MVEYLYANWRLLLWPVIVLGAGWLVRRLLFGFLHRWAERTERKIDDHLVRILRGPFMLWVLMLGIYFAAEVSQLSIRSTEVVSKTLLLLWIVSLTVAASKLAGVIVREYGSEFPTPLPVTTLTQTIVSLTVVAIGLLIVLNTLGISITPILTALGVGGLAVALALQDTLSNLFAGFYISIAGQVRIGDYVRLDSGEEGYVTDISWSSTTIRALANNMIIVPNAKLAAAIVTNYNLPEKRMSLVIPIGVSYDSEPDHVERILVEEAVAGTAEIPGLLEQPAPFVRFTGFGASSLDFNLICQVKEFVDQYSAQHELRKRIFRRFKKEGIEIPFPIRTLYLRESQQKSGSSPPSDLAKV